MSDTNSVTELDNYISTALPSPPLNPDPAKGGGEKRDLANIREALLSIDYGNLEGDNDHDDHVYDGILGDNRDPTGDIFKDSSGIRGEGKGSDDDAGFYGLEDKGTPTPQRWRGVSEAGAPRYRYGEYYGPSSSSSTNPMDEGEGDYDYGVGESSYVAPLTELKSYRPPQTPSPQTSRSSNTAVLQSLRAMQEKLRRMEQERTIALRQCGELSEISRGNVESLGNVREAEVRAGHEARRKVTMECERRYGFKRKQQIGEGWRQAIEQVLYCFHDRT